MIETYTVTSPLVNEEDSVMPLENLPGALLPADISESSTVIVYESSAYITPPFSLQATRLFFTALSLVAPTDKPGKTYQFSLAEFQNVFSITKHSKEALVDAAMELASPKRYSDEVRERYGITQYMYDFEVNNGICTFKIPDKMLPLYKGTNARGEFLLVTTSGFKSSYSHAFHQFFLSELYKAKLSEITIVIKIDYLRSWLVLENRYVDKRKGKFSFINFKKSILEAVMKDLNENDSGITCSYIPLYKGRAVDQIQFNVSARVVTTKALDFFNKFYKELKFDETRFAYDMFTGMNIRNKEIVDAINRFGEDDFQKIAAYVESKEDALPVYAAACLQNNWQSETDLSLRQLFGIRGSIVLQDEEKRDYITIEMFLKQVDDVLAELIMSDFKVYMQRSTPQFYQLIGAYSFQELIASDMHMYILVSIFYSRVVKSGGVNAVTEQIAKKYSDFEIGFVKIKGLDPSRFLSSRSERPKKLALPQLEEKFPKAFKLLKELSYPKSYTQNLFYDNETKELREEEYILTNVRFTMASYSDKSGDELHKLITMGIKENKAGYGIENEETKRLRKQVKKAEENLAGFVQAEEIKSEAEPVLDESLDKYSEIKSYFFSLPEEERNTIIEQMSIKNPFMEPLIKSKTQEELWKFPPIVMWLAQITSEYKVKK